MAHLHIIGLHAAIRMAQQRGYYATPMESGRVLVFYTGDAGSWHEAGRTAITPDGFISRHAFELITGAGA